MIISLKGLKEDVDKMLSSIAKMPELSERDLDEEDWQNEAEIRDTLVTELHDGLKVLLEEMKSVEGGW